MIRYGICLAAVLTFVFSLVIVQTPAPAQGLNVSGMYQVQGSNPDGSRYAGTCSVTKNANGTYTFSWSVGTSYQGTGTLEGDRMTVHWGDKYPVIYSVKNGGNLLIGKWANGAASETLTK